MSTFEDALRRFNDIDYGKDVYRKGWKIRSYLSYNLNKYGVYRYFPKTKKLTKLRDEDKYAMDWVVEE